MFGKLPLALLIAATPALAQEAPPPESGDGATAEAPAPVAYKIKKVCRSVEVVGSSIPRTTCKEKKIPIKTATEQADAEGSSAKDPQSQL